MRLKTRATASTSAGATALIEADGDHETDGVQRDVASASCRATPGALEVMVAQNEASGATSGRRAAYLGEPEGAPPAGSSRGHRSAALDPRDGGAGEGIGARPASRWRRTATPATATSTATSCSTGGRAPASTSALAEMLRAAVDLGGTITGEHGVGLAKRDFLEYSRGLEVVALERRLR